MTPGAVNARPRPAVAHHGTGRQASQMGAGAERGTAGSTRRCRSLRRPATRSCTSTRGSRHGSSCLEFARRAARSGSPFDRYRLPTRPRWLASGDMDSPRRRRSPSALAEPPRPAHLRELFASDPGRAERYVIDGGDLRIDYSKALVDDDVLGALARARPDVAVSRQRRDAMFAGEHINVTEDRAVGHVALRTPRGSTFTIDGHDVVPDVHDVLDRWAAFADRVRSGRADHATSSTSASAAPTSARRWPIEALAAYRHERIRCSFVSNVDGADIGVGARRLRSRRRRCSSSRRRRSARSRR